LKFGSRVQFRVGVDVILGCVERIFLQEDLFLQLQEQGRCLLKKFDNPLLILVWRKGWLQAQALGLEAN